MPSREQIIENAREAVLNLNEILAQDVAHDALESGIDPEDVIEYGFNAAMITIGDLFNQGKVFLPHMIAASEAMNAGIRVLVPENQENHHIGNVKGTVLIGTIEGDIHSIGKDIVATSLRIDGYEVIDLGVDVPVEAFVIMAIELCPDVVATSALMTITMTNQMVLEKRLHEAGIRNKMKTMIGGRPVTEAWAKRIGADIYSANAKDAVEKLNASLSIEKDDKDPNENGRQSEINVNEGLCCKSTE